MTSEWGAPFVEVCAVHQEVSSGAAKPPPSSGGFRRALEARRTYKISLPEAPRRHPLGGGWLPLSELPSFEGSRSRPAGGGRFATAAEAPTPPPSGFDEPHEGDFGASLAFAAFGFGALRFASPIRIR